MTPPVNLHGFREIARTGGDRLLVNNGAGTVQKGTTSFKEKVVAWFRGGYTGQTRIDNRAAIRSFAQALQRSYGTRVARLSLGGLPGDFHTGKPLSTSAIKTAIATADMLADVLRGANAERATGILNTEINTIFQQTTHQTLATTLTGGERAELNMLAMRMVRDDPGFSRNRMSRNDIRQIVGDAVLRFYATKGREFQARFPHLAGLPTAVGKPHSLENVLGPAIDQVAITNRPQARAMDSCITKLGETLDLLSECPVSGQEMQDFRARANQHILDLQTIRGQLDGGGPQGPVRQAMQQEIDGQVAELGRKLNHLTVIGDSVPTSTTAVVQARALWYDSALDVLDQEIHDLQQQAPPPHDGLDAPLLPPPDPRLTALQDLRAALVLERQQDQLLAQPGVQEGDMTGRVKEFPKALNARLKTVFQANGLATDTLSGRLSEAHLERINGQPWNTVQKELHFVGGDGAPHRFGSEIRPAGQLGNIFTNAYNGHGVSCSTYDEAHHTVNLCRTRLTDDGGQVLFSALRHGVHSAFGIPNPVTRHQANLDRAKESLQAVLLEHPALLAQALGGQTVDLDVSSISLLTPDDARDLINSKHSNEKRQWQEQRAVWEQLSDPANHPVTLQVRDALGQVQQVQVRPNVLAFNFGVNRGAVSGLGPLPSSLDLIGGWGNVRETNAKAMEKLLGDTTPGSPMGGRVDQWLQANPLHPKAPLVRKLTEQIRGIWVSDAFMTQGHEHTKLVSRLAVLTHMIGDTAMWNCKSGKDRTGLLDVEAKFLAAQIALTGDVPDPDHVLTESEQAMWREFAISSGNLEIQQMNTGLGGFKTEGVDVINERIGGSGTPGRDYYRGGSHFVKE
ncbi:MAG: hypothetical protein H0S85_03080 [Desulfovibrionaceae bacterium]|nr:hypothetical protein [Desulfovibrionaceae bacterium]